VLGLNRHDALWNISYSDVVLQQWAHYEVETGKSCSWGGIKILDRVIEILKEKYRDGNLKNNIKV
jgi:hypothetical protein